MLAEVLLSRGSELEGNLKIANETREIKVSSVLASDETHMAPVEAGGRERQRSKGRRDERA